MSPPDGSLTDNPSTFSLVLGGPLYQLLRRAHVCGDALELLRRRLIVVTLFAWLPLLLLSTVEGRILNESDVVPFLFDVEVHLRFLIAMPLLIVAELIVHVRMRFVAQQFRERNLIPLNALPAFDHAVGAAMRLRNSTPAEILLIVLVYGVGTLLLWRRYFQLDATTWFAIPAVDGPHLSLAGLWYGYVSLPLFQFLLLRWYFRIVIWARFLWHVSRIDLRLVATHPDRVGGLGFLGQTVYPFAPLLLAHGVLLSGMIADRILFSGMTLLDFKVEIAVMMAFLLCLTLGPLFVFTPRLMEVKRTALREYGTFTQRYVREFDIKWLRGGATSQESLLGNNDIQSLADIGNSFDIVHKMRPVPLTRDAIIGLAAAVAIPLLPLTLTMMSTEELLMRLFKVIF